MSRASSGGGEHAMLQPLRDESRQLDPAVRTSMERTMGASFGDVVVHTGEASSEAAEGLDAAAFTVGRHVVFGPGRYDPGSLRGRMLLAHELAHVVEQRRGGGDPDEGEHLPLSAIARHEGHREGSHETAAQAALGSSALRSPGSIGVGVARQPKKEEQHVPAPTVPMFQYTDEAGQIKVVTLQEAEKLKAEAERRLRSALRDVESTVEIWRQSHKEQLDMGHAESFGDLWDKPSRIFGVASSIRAGVVPPTLGIWHQPIHVVQEARAALDKGDIREAARLLRLATAHLTNAKNDWNEFIEASIGGAEMLVGELEVVRDTSFAIAIAAGGIVAAPVVASGVAYIGATGAAATALTATGTGLATMTGGALLRGTSDVAAQKVVNGHVNLEKTKKYVGEHLKEDFASGFGGGLTKGLQGASIVAKPVSSVGQAVVRNIAVQSGISATTGIVSTTADTTAALAQGKSWEEARDKHLIPGLKETGVGTLSAAVSAPLGNIGQSVAKGGRPLLGKAIEHGGGALVAGGTSLAAGGTWQQARTQMLTSLVTSTLLARGTQGTDKAAAAKAETSPKPAAPAPSATPLVHEMPTATTKTPVTQETPTAQQVTPPGEVTPSAVKQFTEEPPASAGQPGGKKQATQQEASPAPGEQQPDTATKAPAGEKPSEAKSATTGKLTPKPSTEPEGPAKASATPAAPVEEAASPAAAPGKTESSEAGETKAPKKAPSAAKAGATGAKSGGKTKPGTKKPTQSPEVKKNLRKFENTWKNAKPGIWRRLAQNELAARAAGGGGAAKGPIVDLSSAPKPSAGKSTAGTSTAPAAERPFGTRFGPKGEILPEHADWDPKTAPPGHVPAKGVTDWEGIDPIKALTDAELQDVAKTGKMPARVDAELEHARIPQRVGAALIRAGVPPEEASAVTKQTDHENLEPVNRESHALMDEEARKAFGGQRNPTLPRALDSRDINPLRNATDGEIAGIIAALKKPGVDLNSKAGAELRQWLTWEKKAPDRSATWEVP